MLSWGGGVITTGASMPATPWARYVVQSTRAICALISAMAFFDASSLIAFGLLGAGAAPSLPTSAEPWARYSAQPASVMPGVLAAAGAPPSSARVPPTRLEMMVPRMVPTMFPMTAALPGASARQAWRPRRRRGGVMSGAGDCGGSYPISRVCLPARVDRILGFWRVLCNITQDPNPPLHSIGRAPLGSVCAGRHFQPRRTGGAGALTRSAPCPGGRGRRTPPR